MSDISDSPSAKCCIWSCVILFITKVVLLCLFAWARHPGLSIIQFSVPALNKTSNQTIGGDIYIDLKLRNKNKAISLYYVEPFNIAISYYPLEDPYQKYVWEYALPPFFQGNGNTKNIRTLIGEPSKVVQNKDNTTTGMVVSFRIDLVVSYQYNYWVKGDVHTIETVAEVVIDANTGERVSKDRIKLETMDSLDEAASSTTLQLLDSVEVDDGGSEDEDEKKKKKKKSDATTSGPHMSIIMTIYTCLLMYLVFSLN